jgi:hypothetical protein
MNIATTSIIKSTGNKIAAAIIGFIERDIIGIDRIAMGPANPPFEIPNKTTPKEAYR